MKLNLHKNAATTPAQRAYIQENIFTTNTELAHKLGVSTTTIRRWKKRDTIYDRSHIPQKKRTVLTRGQETLVICLRLLLHLSLDDLLEITRSCINSKCSRSALGRCLQKYGISRLGKIRTRTGKNSYKFFPDKATEHMGTNVFFNVIQLTGFLKFYNHQFLYIALDLRTHWVNIEIADDPTQDETKEILNNLIKTHPLKVLDLITLDKMVYIGLPDRSEDRKNIFKIQLLNSICNTYGIRYNGYLDYHADIITELEKIDITTGIKTFLETYLTFTDFKTTLLKCVKKYNTSIRQRSLKQKTPLEKMRSLYRKFPGSFNFRPDQSFGTISD